MCSFSISTETALSMFFKKLQSSLVLVVTKTTFEIPKKQTSLFLLPKNKNSLLGLGWVGFLAVYSIIRKCEMPPKAAVLPRILKRLIQNGAENLCGCSVLFVCFCNGTCREKCCFSSPSNLFKIFFRGKANKFFPLQNN